MESKLCPADIVIDTKDNKMMTTLLDPSTFFSTLPDEIVVRILSHLRLTDLVLRVSPVSRRFRRLHGDCITELYLPRHKYYRTCTEYRYSMAKVEKVLALAHRGLRGLYVELQGRGEDKAVAALERCPGLAKLSISCKGTPGLFQALREHGSSSLRRLEVSFAEYFEPISCRNLRHVRVNNCDGFGDEAMLALGRGCESLESFSYSASPWQADGYRLSKEAVSEFLLTRKDTLKILHLSSWETRASSVVIGAMNRCRRLEVVSIDLEDGDVRVPPAGLRLPRLRYLSVNMGRYGPKFL